MMSLMAITILSVACGTNTKEDKKEDVVLDAVTLGLATVADAASGTATEKVFTITVNPKSGYKFAAGFVPTLVITITASSSTGTWEI